MSFAESVATLSPVIRIWVLWLTIVMIATPLFLLLQRSTRRDGLIVLASTIAVIATMHALFAAVGFVRLLGLPHILIWTPLAYYLYSRLRGNAFPAFSRALVFIFLISIGNSLVFDYIDVARYLLGDRGDLLTTG